MDEIQNAMSILMENNIFWYTTVSDPIWDDCKYLAANTKYWRLYYTSNKEQTEYIQDFEKNHTFITQLEYDTYDVQDTQNIYF